MGKHKGNIKRETGRVDIRVAKQLRKRREALKLTQKQLGERVGLTAQQIQKYEAAHDRITVARLFDLAQSLRVPVSYFYEGLEHNTGRAGALTLRRVRTQ
jgi:transcriptional regulator with XRE-family HTH domain